MRRKQLLIGAGVLLIVIALVVLANAVLGHHSTPQPKQTKPSTTKAASPASNAGSTAGTASAAAPVLSNDQLNNTIKANTQDPTLLSGDYTIVSTDSPSSGWYIVSVLPNAPQSDEEVVIVAEAADGTTRIVAGPGTSFSRTDLNAQGVPQAVQDKLVVSND